jgi:hypothetical protein
MVGLRQFEHKFYGGGGNLNGFVFASLGSGVCHRLVLLRNATHRVKFVRPFILDKRD